MAGGADCKEFGAGLDVSVEPDCKALPLLYVSFSRRIHSEDER